MTHNDLPTDAANGQPKMACANEACDEFATLYSAQRGDYFWANPSETVTCGNCDEPMRLARERRGVQFLTDEEVA